MLSREDGNDAKCSVSRRAGPAGGDSARTSRRTLTTLRSSVQVSCGSVFDPKRSKGTLINTQSKHRHIFNEDWPPSIFSMPVESSVR